MGKIEHVTVGLPAEALDAVRKSVEAGDYATEADAIAAAVRTWRDVRDAVGRSDEELGALWDEGLGSGRGRFPTFEHLIAEAEQRQQISGGRA